MNTYKLGNKVDCIIRFYAGGTTIGDVTAQYDNQPYTILKDVQATLSYGSHDKNAIAVERKLGFSHDFVDTIRLSDIPITDKILKLIYSKNEEKLCTATENLVSDEVGHIFFNRDLPEYYQVFVIDNEGNLEAAYGTLTTSYLPVKKENSPYLVCYNYLGDTSVSLDHSDNIYLKMDLTIKGSVGDTTTDMFLHIDKCVLTVDKNLYFNSRMNAVDLICRVINDDTTNHYITLE